MKKMIKKIVLRLWPELESGNHLPQLAVVVGIPDPPVNGETHSPERPFYAVNCRLLTKDGSIDEDMPLMRDIPVAMTAAAAARGFAALPPEGTIVEIAFAFGCQSKPFIRSILPTGMQLPAIDKRSMRWQQSADSFQEVDSAGNWKRETSKTIFDISDYSFAQANTFFSTCNNFQASCGNDFFAAANQIYLGSTGIKAQGKIRFSRLDMTQDLIIPANTIISNISGSLRLLTTVDGLLPRGSNSIEIPVIAAMPGEEYNLAPGEYNTLQSNLSVTVINEDDWLIVEGISGDNLLSLVSNYMNATILALDVLANHTHPEVDTISEGSAVTIQKTAIQLLKAKLDLFVKM